MAKGPVVRILAFHDVLDSKWFAEIIERLSKEVVFITPEQFKAKDFSRWKINVLLSFDDGYQSWIENVLPVLQRENIKALFFVSSGLVDKALIESEARDFCEKQLQRSYRPIITWDGVRDLVSAGHTIGGHTVMHLNLKAASKEKQLNEIISDKSRIEKELNITLYDFAYPFGTSNYYDHKVVKAVQQSGYTRAYTAESNFVSLFNEGKSYQFPRLCIENIATPRSVTLWTKGGYDIVNRIKKAIW